MSYFTVEKCNNCGGTPVLKRRWWQMVVKLCWGRCRPWKISELEPIKEISPEDVILISDISEQKSKKICIEDLLEYVRRNNK